MKPLALPATDIQKELAKDAKAGVGPLRFAVPHPVQVSPVTHGTWEQVPDGRIWRLRLRSDGSTDLNLGFSTFWLPQGATLHLVSESEAYYQGPYTAGDNKDHGQLWTPVVPGSSMVVELFVPSKAQGEPQLVISQVGAGYRDLFHRRKDLGLPKAGTCNIDVVCPQSDPWRQEIRSVARYTVNGSGLCTGTLIMNAAGDFKNYFLTANHCGLTAGNAITVVAYWNFESPTCGQHGGGSLSQNQSGAIFRAARADVDVALIELDDVPAESFRVYYAGWDRSGAVPPGAVGIHHPNGDEKSISFSTTPLTTVNNCIGTGGVNSHWHVQWSAGVTEPGSSGSGLWDSSTHMVVGFLSGGASACGGADLTDCYGKVSVAWDGTSSATRLKDWLDPQNTGLFSIAGREKGSKPFIVEAGATLATEGCSPTNGVLDPGETVTVNLALRNIGTTNTANLVATLLATNGVTSPSAPQSYGVVTANGASVSRAFSLIATGACGGSVTARLQLQDGTNNLGTITYSFVLGTPAIGFSQNFDGVTAPALPSGWSAALSGVGVLWATETTLWASSPNSVFAPDVGDIGENQLISPSIPVNAANAQLSFDHYYDLEEGYDGGVLEISINGGGFTDILTAGGSFVANGYNDVISGDYGNALGNRSAWTGFSAGFVTTTVNLPPAAAGQSVRLRWYLGTDESVGADGWYVDKVQISGSYNCCNSLAPYIVNTRRLSTNKVAFSFGTVSGHTYYVEGKTNLSGTNWIRLQTNTGDNSLKSFTNTTTGQQQRYFRVNTQ